MVDMGEVLFKDSGLSGIVSFNLSTLFSRQHNFTGNISIDLLPNISTDDLKEMLIRRKALNLPMHKYFVGLFQNQVSDEILRQSKLNTNKISNSLSVGDIDTLATTIKSLSFNVDGYYDNNQVYSGGVSLTDLTDELQHKNIPNLYITGELCDVDGECGGYNLQWAWTSGHIVGENL
jgi:predicted flavoprotein YhiN